MNEQEVDAYTYTSLRYGHCDDEELYVYKEEFIIVYNRELCTLYVVPYDEMFESYLDRRVELCMKRTAKYVYVYFYDEDRILEKWNKPISLL